MASKWFVEFMDDDEDGVQVASFGSQRDAELWISNQEMHNRYDNVHFRVVNGPCQAPSSVLTEGKHWPEDYIKTAYNAIKSSALGQQPWYSDNYIKQDISTFVSEFAPLSHKSSNLGFFMAIVRWFIEYSGTSAQKYQEFIEGKIDGVIKALLRITADKSYDSQHEAIKKMSFSDFEKLAERVNAEASHEDIGVASKMKFKVVPIYSYDEFHDTYGGSVTGYKGESEWCHANGQGTYDSAAWTNGGKNMFFVIEADNWEKIKPPKKKPADCYDKYGMSLIAILVDVMANRLLHSTSRWNHVILPKSGAADSMFESWQQLNKATGLDVEKACYSECAKLRGELQAKADAVNAEAAKALNDAKTITGTTIPKRIRQDITEVVVPDSVESIGDNAFEYCTSLTSIKIPSSVQSIGNWAFTQCTSLESVEVPSSVKSIGQEAFYWCTRLERIDISNGTKSIGELAFRQCTSLKHIKIPSSVESIGYGAFIGCTSLESIIIPASVQRIEFDAFLNCSSLKSIVFRGRTIEQVKTMRFYPWGIKDTSIIKAEDALSESELPECTKLWVDCVRPAPDGCTWVKSADEFIHFIDDNGIYGIELIDFDGGPEILKCIKYLEFIGADGLRAAVHAPSPESAAEVKQAIRRNQWDEVASVCESFDDADYDSLAAGSAHKLDEGEDTDKKSGVVSALKKASKDFQNAASNYDPQQFAKIVVAFDDLTSAVGSYDFKKKKQMTEGDSCNDVDSALQAVKREVNGAGAECTSIELLNDKFHHNTIVLHGSFNDTIPLSELKFNYTRNPKFPGWHEGTRCMNKWRGAVKAIIDEVLPDGI